MFSHPSIHKEPPTTPTNNIDRCKYKFCLHFIYHLFVHSERAHFTNAYIYRLLLYIS